MLKYLNPIFAIKILINTASEFRHWLYYCKTVNRLNKSGILTKYGLKNGLCQEDILWYRPSTRSSFV